MSTLLQNTLRFFNKFQNNYGVKRYKRWLEKTYWTLRRKNSRPKNWRCGAWFCASWQHGVWRREKRRRSAWLCCCSAAVTLRSWRRFTLTRHRSRKTASAMMRHTGRLQACIRNMPTICSCRKKSTMLTEKSAVCTKLMTVTGRFCWKRITKKGSRTAKPWNIILTARKKKSAIIARANPKAEKLPIIRTAISDAKEATSEAKRTVCLKNITKTARSRHP